MSTFLQPQDGFWNHGNVTKGKEYTYNFLNKPKHTRDFLNHPYSLTILPYAIIGWQNLMSQ